MGPDAEGMNQAMQAMLFKAMWSQGGGQGDPKGGAPQFSPALVANMAQLPGQPPMNQAMAAAMASQMDLMLGLQHNPQIAAAAAAAYQRQLIQAASLAQQQMKGSQQGKDHGLMSGSNLHADARNRSRSRDSASKKNFRCRESQSPAPAGHPRTEHHQSRKSSFEGSKKMHNNNSISSSLNSSTGAGAGAPGSGLEGSNALNLSSGGGKESAGDRKKRSRSVSSDEGSLSDGPLSELSANNLDNNDDTSNYGDDDGKGEFRLGLTEQLLPNEGSSRIMACWSSQGSAWRQRPFCRIRRTGVCRGGIRRGRQT